MNYNFFDIFFILTFFSLIIDIASTGRLKNIRFYEHFLLQKIILHFICDEYFQGHYDR